MAADRDIPPTEWPSLEMAGVTRLTDDIYFGWLSEANPIFWHWCPTHERWLAAGTSSHELVSRDPLHLEPSLLWQCCGTHGWVRDGTWTNA